MNNKFPLFGPNSTGRQPLPGAPKMGPWGDPRSGDPLAPVVPVTPGQMERARNLWDQAVPVIMPRTTYAPEGARTLDLRKQITVAAGAVDVDLMSFVCLPSATTVVYLYSLVLPGGPATGVSWNPTIDGQRVLQYHGDPGTDVSPNPFTTLNLPTSFDYAETGLARCQILLQPNQTIRWGVSNAGGAPIVMGVRMVGYVDLSQQLLSSKFGD